MNKTRDTDDGVCGILDSSLREAIAAANSGNTITFSVTGTIILTSSQLIIDKDLTIEGPGSGDLAIRGNNSSRVFNTGGTVTIADVTIRDGRRDGFAGGGGISNGGRLTLTDSTVSNSTAHLGGGIYNDGTGTLTLDNSTISGNSATDGGGIWNGGTGTLTLNNSTVSGNTARGRGGGIYNMSDQGTLTITSSTISDNTANRTQGDYQGGGIYNGSGATLTLTNSTVSGNIAAFAGDWGGIFNFVDGTLTLTNSTVSDNRADRGGNGGGIRNFGTVTLTNTIIADNPSGGDCLGSITSLGFNLDSDGTCGLGGPGDVSNVDPLLGPPPGQRRTHLHSRTAGGQPGHRRRRQRSLPC